MTKKLRDEDIEEIFSIVSDRNLEFRYAEMCRLIKLKWPIAFEKLYSLTVSIFPEYTLEQSPTCHPDNIYREIIFGIRRKLMGIRLGDFV